MPSSVRRSLDFGLPSSSFSNQWRNPRDVFSVLLILGGDVVRTAIAQLAGTPITPVTFSFGWVAYSVTAVVSAIGETKLLPPPEYPCKVINGGNGYVRDNASFVIGRILRDFEFWMDPAVRAHMDSMISRRWAEDRAAAALKMATATAKTRRDLASDAVTENAAASAATATAPASARVTAPAASSTDRVPRPAQAGLCVSIYRAAPKPPAQPDIDALYLSGFAIVALQLGIAAIPLGLDGDWGILLVTASGILLAFATGSIPQWRREKWACRRNSDKDIILTRGNGSQHALVIRGVGLGLNLEDLALGPATDDLATRWVRASLVALASFWVLLLITAAGIEQNTWYLLAVGMVGILHNIVVAGWRRSPGALGVPLVFEEVLGETRAMESLYSVEETYPGIGRSLLGTFFPGDLREKERKKWEVFKRTEKERRESKDRNGRA